MKFVNLFKLFRHIKIKSFKKGEILIAEGSLTKEVYFIRKGLVRSYVINGKGDEITFQLYAETNVFTNAHTILFDEKSRFNYQALENVKLYTIDFDHFLKISSTNQELLHLNRNLFSKRIIQRVFLRLESFALLTPEERYSEFLENRPNLIQRVPDKYIANVLGITPVSLSRIKNRIANKS